MVQRSAMRSWDMGEDFRELLRADAEATQWLPGSDLEELFDYGYYTRYVDDTFQRIGLLPAKVAV